MRVLVCFKIIPEYGMLCETDWQPLDDRSVDVSFVRQQFNCYDESGLEMALKLRDRLKRVTDTTELTALTLDDDRADLFLRHLAALEYDRVVRIQADRYRDRLFDPHGVSRVLCSGIHTLGKYDLVILGMQGAEGDNGQTGFLVSERLKWPCIREVTDIAQGQGPCILRVTSRSDKGEMVQVVRLPVVLIMGNSLESPFLRVPTLGQKLGASKKEIRVLTERDLGCDASQGSRKKGDIVRLFYEQKNRQCVFIEGKTGKEKAFRLYDEYLGEWLKK